MTKPLKKNWYFLIAGLFSSLFIISMICIDTIPSLNWTVENLSSNKNNLIPPTKHIGWTIVLYFTFQSNVLVCIYLFLRGLNIIQPKTNTHHKMFQLIVTINITITMIIYWTVLAPFSSIWSHGGLSGVLKRVNTLMVHLITPIFMLIGFHIDKLSKEEKGVIIGYKKVPFVLIYPLVWMILAVVVYFSTRELQNFNIVQVGSKFKLVDEVIGSSLPVVSKYTGIAVYFFLAFDNVSLFVFIGIPIAITFIFIGMGFLFIAISNPDSKINKIKFKHKKK